MSLPSDLANALAITSDSTVTPSATVSSVDIFVEGTGPSPTGGVKTMTMVDANGNAMTVQNLPTKICIDMGAAGSTCKYHDDAANTWLATGIDSSVDSNGHLHCCTPHFTSFGGFSASAGVMLSALAALVVLAVQLLM
jgi:hypothetical protein